MSHAASPVTAPASSWLFSKQNESIRIVRPSDALVIITEGPAHERIRREFPDEAALQSFEVEMAESLAERGWILLGKNYDRRQRGDDAARTGAAERRKRN